MAGSDRQFILRAIELARQGIDSGAGGPFGAVIVKDGVVISEGWNEVTSKNDPTAHAEVVAIRKACAKLDSFQLDGCVLYSSCEPCPMCLGAIYWARPDKLIFAGTREDAAKAGFDDQFIYNEISLEIDERSIETENMLREAAAVVFADWLEMESRIKY
ncbi:MAG: nucleoside deaminase [Acidobacteria bacterium]|nr:nucleoside deaminase [Acidobacteriota bacterium]